MTLLLVLLVPIGSAIAEEHKGLKPGTLAPRFQLQTLDGKDKIDSRGLFKKSPVTVLILWDSYCPDCLATVRACQKFAGKVESRGIQVIGINYDTENLASVRGFLKVGRIKFPNLHDPTGKTVKAYRAKAYDFSYFVIDKKGVVRFAAYDHPPEIEKELLKAVNLGLGDKSPLLEKKTRKSPEFCPDTE